jgi:hypothetical protein
MRDTERSHLSREELRTEQINNARLWNDLYSFVELYERYPQSAPAFVEAGSPEHIQTLWLIRQNRHVLIHFNLLDAVAKELSRRVVPPLNPNRIYVRDAAGVDHAIYLEPTTTSAPKEIV